MDGASQIKPADVGRITIEWSTSLRNGKAVDDIHQKPGFHIEIGQIENLAGATLYV
jgi:hypothetical protein